MKGHQAQHCAEEEKRHSTVATCESQIQKRLNHFVSPASQRESGNISMSHVREHVAKLKIY